MLVQPENQSTGIVMFEIEGLVLFRLLDMVGADGKPETVLL